MVEIPGRVIGAFRERLGVSQDALADLIGVSQSLISAVEIGRGPVSRRLLRILRAKSEAGVLNPGFHEFLAEGSVELSLLDVDLGVARPIPLLAWNERLDLLEVPDPGAGERIWVPGLSDDMRGFRFVPAPNPLAPDTVAVFRRSQFRDLKREQIALLQLKAKKGHRGFPAGVGHLGRAVTSRSKGKVIVQFEPTTANVPIIDLTERSVAVLLVCAFRGRYTV